jgi:hypothetical protein
MNKETEIEDIVRSMMYVQDEITAKEEELKVYKDIYYKYKKYLKDKYPEENIDILEYTVKQKILQKQL